METTNNKTEGFKITGNWSDQSKALKTRYSQLTDTDLKLENGKENDMLKRVETRLGKNRDEVIDIIKKGQSKVS
ncbi:hypothetical protein [Owenweeksia hongkongensis]|uniref:hypothetical protein n=1 Tax=Owenweeksia hongkongensis TaxID=253245 RepID=UPI003A94382A